MMARHRFVSMGIGGGSGAVRGGDRVIGEGEG
jgi:hypothetical protein